jgi:ABC-type Fe3+/spermidine/putrescine transport system ATPase subunit
LKRLQQETGVTAVYVTHDQAEALAISDRIAVMHEGRIAQIGRPKEIYSRPSCEFVANFIGRTNLIKGVLARDAAAESMGPVKTTIGELLCFFPNACAAGKSISLVVRPEHIAIANGEALSRETNRLSGHVRRETYLGEIVEYVVAVAGGELLVRTAFGGASRDDAVTLQFAAGQTVALAEDLPSL